MAVGMRVGVALAVAVGTLVDSTAAFSFIPPVQRLSSKPTNLNSNNNRVQLRNAPGNGHPPYLMAGDSVGRGRMRDVFGRERSKAAVLRASASGSGGSKPAVDFLAIAKYIAGTGVEFGTIMGILYLLQGNLLPRVPAKWTKPFVFFSFGFLAMKSRTFSVLNARRPEISSEKEAKSERRRPDWMPPPKVFPFIWITIGVLRAVSSTLVFEALGGKLVTLPIASMVLHLSIGDTWNHINNVEKRLGVAVPVVFLVWLSVAHAAFRYYQALPKAGLILLPSVIWIAIANFLVQSIWRLNGKESLYPAKKSA